MTATTHFRPLLGILTASLAACGGGGEAPVLDAASRGAIEATLDRYVAASNEGDAEALAELYAEDALLLPPDHEPIHGRAAIVEFWRQGTDTGLEVSPLRLEVDGDVAYMVGRYRLPPTDEEEADSGQYVLCLKRQADGAWKLTADIWNGSGEVEVRGPDEARPRGTISTAVRRYGGTAVRRYGGTAVRRYGGPRVLPHPRARRGMRYPLHRRPVVPP